MTINEIFADKTLKPKEKTEKLCQRLDAGDIEVNDLITYADRAKDAEKATCIESLEYLTKKDATAIDVKVLEWIVAQLGAKAPHIKWESARVIGNTISLHPDIAERAVAGLLDNANNDGTVVRWSAAYALGEILKLKLPINETLLPALNNIMNQEEKNSIKKIYSAAIKKAK
ncbi:MAG: hypothetical protein IAE95_13885 [Chitinophagaceae bacterium]|nr:hypothetical protein [Chitinophagaceae bacterium]